MGRKDYFPELFKAHGVIGCHRGASESFMGEEHALTRGEASGCDLRHHFPSFILLLSVLYTGIRIF